MVRSLHCFSSTLILTTLAATATAQSSIVLPPEYDRAWGRGSSSALGGNSTRTQMIFAQPFMVGTTVLGFGLRPTASTTDRAAFTADIEIRCSSTAATPGALSSTFANNVGNDEVVVLPQQTVNIQAMPANRGTGEFAEFLFTTPFVFGTNANTNLCVELLVYGRSAGASWSTDRGFASTNGRASTAGIGCGSATMSSSSSGGSYVSGATINLTLSGAAPNSLATLLPSFDQKEFAPGLPLPFSLSNFGGDPACMVLVNPALGPISYITDAAGAASHSFTVPAGLGQLGLGWQWGYFVAPTSTNPLGVETTASRATWIGPEVIVPNAQYVWDLFSVTATTGSATTDSVPIVKLITQ